MKLPILAATAFVAVITSANAAVIISEIDPTGSSTSTYAADWFELTNTGTTAVGITGWKMDDNSNSFALAVPLRNVTSIAPGQSVVFVEGTATGTTDATIDANFETAWFGSNVPFGFVIGNYGGSGVGLSSTADAVNIFDSTGTLVTRLDFGTSTAGVTFDNAAGLNNVTLSTLSVAGTNGAFVSPTNETGSPGVIPEPASCGLVLSGLAAMGLIRRRRTNI